MKHEVALGAERGTKRRVSRRIVGLGVAFAVVLVVAGVLWFVHTRHSGTAGETDAGQLKTRRFSLAVPGGVHNQSTKNDGSILLNMPTTYGKLKVEIFTSDLTMTQLSKQGAVSTQAVTISGARTECQYTDLADFIRGTYSKPQIRYSVECNAIPLPSKNNHTEIHIDALSASDLTTDEQISVRAVASGVYQTLKIKNDLAL